MIPFRQAFVEFAIRRNVLCFGEFKTKSGRLSPYFFNAGLFNDGESLRALGGFYADALAESGLAFDMLFGPAYKGIPLAAGLAIELAARGRNVPFSFNRKEAKDHGEGGLLIGAPLAGRVLIVDDVITDGGAKREAIELVKRHGATPCGIIISLDRKERGKGELSATQELTREFGLPVIAVATLDDIVSYLTQQGVTNELARVESYRAQYGVMV